LDVLVRNLPADALTASERRTVEELVELRDEVERANSGRSLVAMVHPFL
jgi:hypothetical protein